MPQLTLFFRPTCPYSQKVLNYMKQNNITLPLKDISNESNRQELIQVGGKQQIPCLIIDGKAMYESDDIIAWLKANHK